MFKIKAVLLSFVLVLISPLALATDATPKVYSVLFYADWCGSCKVLDPAIEKARGQSDLDNAPVLFVRLDLTDATKRHQAQLMAHALGLGEFYKKNAGSTGFMLLINAETKTVISRITKVSDAKEITSKIKEAISNSAS